MPDDLSTSTKPQENVAALPAPAPHQHHGKSHKPRSRARSALFTALPVALLAGGLMYVLSGAVVSIDNAYVRSDMVNVTTDVDGIVSEVDVQDNQPVKAGELLFRLDAQPFQLALDKANAQLTATVNELNALKTSYGDMQMQINQAQADIDYYQAEYNRQKSLADVRVASHSTLDEARHNLAVAQQRHASLIQQLAGIAANLNGNPDGAVEDHPRYKEALAARDEAARQLAHTEVHAPMDGIATNVPALQPGQYLKDGSTAFTLVSNDIWVEATPKETELTYVKPGQPVTISVDTYPGVEWQGRVESISPASSSSFSLLPAQNTSGNWVKVVQRIPMRISITDTAGKPTLRMGMSVVADINTGHKHGLHLFGGTAQAADYHD